MKVENQELFYQLRNSEWNAVTKELTYSAAKVLFHLKTINPWGDRNLETETKDVADATGLGLRTVQKALHELHNKGFIELEITKFKFLLKSISANHSSSGEPQFANHSSSGEPQFANHSSSGEPQFANHSSSDEPQFASRRTTVRQNEPQFAKTNHSSPTTAESIDMQGFQNPSYSLDSLNLKKDSLSPKGSLSDEFEERERGFANAPEEPDPEATEPDSVNQLIATINGANPKTQSAAPPPPEIFAIKSWAEFVAPGPDKGFWESVLKKVSALPAKAASPDCAAESWIRKQGHALWSKYQETLPPPAAAQTIAEPIAQTWDLGDAIARIEITLAALKWTKADAVAWMVDQGKWPQKQNATLRQGKTFNLAVLEDAQILELVDVLETLCTPTTPTRLKTP